MRTAILISILFFTRTVSAAVFINEIAWMGTSDSASNEWIELASDGSSYVDMTGWILSIEGKKDIALSGSISAGGFYLIERTDDTTVPTVPADLIASFGTGLANTGVALSLKNVSGVVVDRVDGTQGWTIGGVVAGDNTTKETAQKGMNGWVTGVPTPRSLNTGATSAPAQGPNTNTTQTTTTTVSAPTTPQITAQAGPQTRVVLAGAPVVFEGKISGLENNSSGMVRTIWSFGDGASADGESVSHVYYYPGEYTAILDVVSGSLTATDRMLVRVVLPNVSLRTGGDVARSFVVVENNGVDELDLSGWQISSGGKTFTFPKNTILGARKSATFASEVTGLATPSGSIAELLFPNGSRVATKIEPSNEPAVFQALSPKPTIVSQGLALVSDKKPIQASQHQEALVINAISDSQTSSPTSEGGNLWPWYTGAAFLGALALLGLRLTQEKKIGPTAEPTADDFEIIEDEKDEEPH